MAKFNFTQLYAVAATLRKSARGTSYLMVECAEDDSAKSGAQKLIGEWDPQLELFEEVMANMPNDPEENKRYRLTDAVDLGLGCVFNETRGVPRLVSRRFVLDDNGSLVPQDDRVVNSVRGVALKRFGEEPAVMIDSELIRRCMLRDVPKQEGTQYLPVRGEDYSRYYLDVITWEEIREELFGDAYDASDDEVSE